MVEYFNVCDSTELDNKLTQILFIVEVLNYEIVSKTKKEQKFILMEALNKFYLTYSNCKDWQEISKKIHLPPMVHSCLSLGFNPNVDAEFLDLLFASMFNVKKGNKDDLNYSKTEKTVYDVPTYYFLRQSFSFFRSDGKVFFLPSSHSYFNHMDIDFTLSSKTVYTFLDEPFDPITIIQQFLMKYSNLREDPASHYVQRWIRNQFKLSFQTIFTKITFPRLTNLFNSIFYGSAKIERSRAKTFRSSNFDLHYFLYRIEEFMLTSNNPDRNSVSLKQTLGIFLLLRLCYAVRVRYLWYNPRFDQNPDKIKTNPTLLNSLFEGFICINALSPLEYNYFQSKSFGSYSCIPGINFIFRGGLLPYHNEGKVHLVTGGPGAGKTTYALQRMVEIAFYGGLSIYFSFEENYELILDRLNSFRLVNPRHFKIIEVNEENFEEKLRDVVANNPKKGILALYSYNHGLNFEAVIKVINRLQKILTDQGIKWRAVALDSINSLFFQENSYAVLRGSGFVARKNLKNLLMAIKRNHFFGLVLSEKGDENFSMLPYLCDVAIDFSQKSGRRYLQVIKARNQNFHAGIHPYRISDGVGMIVYPSLNSVLGSLRHKMKTTLSEERLIYLPKPISNKIKLNAISEKSLTLIEGPTLSGKMALLLSLITANTTYELSNSPNNVLTEKTPKNILVVTFKTPENRYSQRIRAYELLANKWQSIPNTYLRWFSPGTDLPAEQIISSIWKLIREAKRENNPLDRIVFEEVESAKKLIPDIKSNSLFWPTIVELVGAEALTSFFVSDTFDDNPNPQGELHSYMDYVFNISFTTGTTSQFNRTRRLTIKKWTDPKTLTPHGAKRGVDISLDELMQSQESNKPNKSDTNRADTNKPNKSDTQTTC